MPKNHADDPGIFPGDWKRLVAEGLQEAQQGAGQDFDEALEEIWAEIEK
jgi:hypothetical protein